MSGLIIALQIPVKRGCSPLILEMISGADASPEQTFLLQGFQFNIADEAITAPVFGFDKVWIMRIIVQQLAQVGQDAMEIRETLGCLALSAVIVLEQAAKEF